MSEGDLEVSGEMKEELAAGPCLVKLLKRSKPTPADDPEDPPPEDEEQEAEPPPVQEDVPDALVRVTQLVYTNASHSQEDKQRGVTKQARNLGETDLCYCAEKATPEHMALRWEHTAVTSRELM
uniref:Uncharacterized protein n=1 Tax=Timema bartmani TaxID=61472 RepID=A0A7R9HWH2_9NEOP|nr:unnamed protein product [Timema bartmani]